VNDAKQEPVAWAVMSGSRSYDVYQTRGEANAICRWLCEQESSDIWRAVPLVPGDATPQPHTTHGERSVHPCGNEPVAWAAVAKNGRPMWLSYSRQDADVVGMAEVVPLYRQPQTCPHVVGRTTLHCSLTPLKLTDKEREAIAYYVGTGGPDMVDATLRSLLERTK